MDVPAVAVTLNTNDFGGLKTLAILSQVATAKAAMNATANSINGNLITGGTYLHGVCLADFAVTCGNLPGITMWAPVQSECDLGTLANEIDQTLFLDEVFVNSLEFSYTTGANATENYNAETDNKMWLLNEGRFVNYLEATVVSGSLDLEHDLGYDLTSTIPTLSTGNLAFLRKTTDGAPAVTMYDENLNEMVNVGVVAGTDPVANAFVFDTADSTLHFPATSPVVAADDIIQMVFAADKYSQTAGNKYFELLDGTTGPTRPYDVGALRQGQVEVYLVDVDSAAVDYDNAWRLTGATISADLTREPLSELGHLGPYDRPLTLPIPITVTIDSTAGDLENWAKFAGQDYTAIDDIDLSDLMTKDNLILVVKVFEQTDEEAGGTSANRKIVSTKDYFNNGTKGTYIDSLEQEYAMKTVIVKNLKITDEGMTLDVGANATQTFGFRSTNDLFVVKGDLDYGNVAAVARSIA